MVNVQGVDRIRVCKQGGVKAGVIDGKVEPATKYVLLDEFTDEECRKLFPKVPSEVQRRLATEYVTLVEKYADAKENAETKSK